MLLLLGQEARGLGPKIEFNPVRDAFYDEKPCPVMASEEKNIFTPLPDADSRQEFIEELRSKRDTDLYAENNELMNESLDWVKNANKRFEKGIPGRKTDRGYIHIFMDPRDDFGELFNHNDPDIGEPILWWADYDRQQGIEFAKERKNNTYKIRPCEVNFFCALDNLHLGQPPIKKSKKREFINFNFECKAATEILISLPVDISIFREEIRLLRIDMDFLFFVCAKDKNKIEAIN
jgi:GWxTD domain-containing protein